MKILLTRPQEDAARFAERLRRLGHEVLCASLLSVRFLDGPVLTLDGVEAVLATSANGVRALARRAQRRDLPLFAVGPQTAEAAKLAGFSRVESAAGDSGALAAAVPRWARPQDGALFYACGADHAGRLEALLTTQGFLVETQALYEVVVCRALPEAVREALTAKRLDAAFFFSPRSAAAFRDCVKGAQLAGTCPGLWAIAISGATAEALKPLEFREVLVAEKPNQDALVDSLAILSAR